MPVCKEQSADCKTKKNDMTVSTRAPARCTYSKSLRTSSRPPAEREISAKQKPSELPEKKTQHGPETCIQRVLHKQTQNQPSAKTSTESNSTTAQRTNCTTKQTNKDGLESKDNAQYYLNCYCTNANSFMNKRNEFEAILDIWKPKIIGITESWCDDSVLDSELSLDGYTLHREDKKSGKIGGVLLYIHNDLQAVRCKELSCTDFESSIWCEVKLNNKDTLLVGVCYRSPNSPDKNNHELLEQLKKTDKVNASHKLIMGDFNFKEIDWDTLQVQASDNHPATAFFDVTQDLYLVQHVNFPTRFREGQKPSRLDLVFTNEEFMVENISGIAPLGKSDHIGVVWTYVCSSGIELSDNHHTSLNFGKGDYNSMKQYFRSINWEEEMQNLNCDDAWQFLKEKFEFGVKDYVPLKKPKKKYKPRWMTSKVKKAVKKKYALYQKYRKSQQYQDYLDYKKQNNRTRKIVRRAQANLERDLMKNFKTQPKAFYSR